MQREKVHHKKRYFGKIVLYAFLIVMVIYTLIPFLRLFLHPSELPKILSEALLRYLRNGILLGIMQKHGRWGISPHIYLTVFI